MSEITYRRTGLAPIYDDSYRIKLSPYAQMIIDKLWLRSNRKHRRGIRGKYPCRLLGGKYATLSNNINKQDKYYKWKKD